MFTFAIILYDNYNHIFVFLLYSNYSFIAVNIIVLSLSINQHVIFLMIWTAVLHLQ